MISLAVSATQNAAFILPPLLVEISSDLDISVAVAGQLATATFAAWAISVLSVGPLSDSFGRRPVVLAGLLALFISVTVSAFAPNIETFLVLRVLTGLGAGTMPPNAVGAISDVISPEKRAQAIGALLAISLLSTVVSGPTVPLLADWVGWRYTFIVAGLLVGAGLLFNFLWFPRDSGERVRALVIFPRYRALISMQYFRAALTVNISHRIAYWAVISFLPAYLIQAYGLSIRFAALPLTIFAIGQVVGSYLGGFFANMRARALIISVVIVAGGACGLLSFVVEINLWSAVAIATISTCLLSIPFPLLVAASTEYSGDSKATGVGIMGFSNQFGGTLGGALSGTLLAYIDYEGIGYLCLGVAVASSLMVVAFRRHLKRNED